MYDFEKNTRAQQAVTINSKSLLLFSVLLFGLFSLTSIAAEISVTEKRLENGDSEISVTNNGKVTATYKLNMSTHHYPATSPDDKLVKTFKSWKYGAFLCFNSNQYSGTEFCSSKNPVKDFQPSNLDMKQWVETLKKAGMNYAVLTVRHTSDFLLWDSKTSTVTVTNTDYGKDLVKEYVEECRKAGIIPGIYYCLWGDGWRPNPNARAIILAQIYELATQYGEIPYFWLDMAHHVKWMPKDLKRQELYDMIKNINPDTVVMYNNGVGDGSRNKAFPSDVVNGEMVCPPAGGHNPWRTIKGKKYYIPFEYEPCSQKWEKNNIKKWDYDGYLGFAWFTYGEGKGFEPSRPYSPLFLYGWIKKARGLGADNVLISCAPDHTGQFREEDVEQLTELGKLLKKIDQ